MADGDVHLLEQMRRRRSGWGEDDFDRLYRSFGFREITRARALHRVYVHPEYPAYARPLGGIAPWLKVMPRQLSVSSTPCLVARRRKREGSIKETQNEEGFRLL